jgi:endonuclease/exonuclease/phosphatase family metal-dependent hydrolase
VIDWNIHYGCPSHNNDCGISGPDYVLPLSIDFMVSLNPDVLLLEEVSRYNEDQPEIIKNALIAKTGKTWDYECNNDGGFGDCVYTWLPVTGKSVTTMTVTGLVTSEDGSTCYLPSTTVTMKNLPQMQVTVNGVNINIFAAHNNVCPHNRNIFMQHFMSWMAQFPYPQIVGGDWNSGSEQTAMVTLQTVFEKMSGEEPTHTINWPIDYVFRSKTEAARLTKISNSVVRPVYSGGLLSDHYALVVNFEVR